MELACKELVFHFNKKSLEDPTVPAWVLKTQGKSYYINHVACQCPWSTKETPDNPTTKGSIKVKKCLLTIDGENNAMLDPLTEDDIRRLKRKEEGYIRVITKQWNKLKEYLTQMQIDHGPVKKFTGVCTSTYYVTEFVDKGNMMMLTIALGNQVRELMPNEFYYELYDDPKYANQEEIDTDEVDYNDDED